MATGNAHLRHLAQCNTVWTGLRLSVFSHPDPQRLGRHSEKGRLLL
jgi:hypothetical protein